MTAGREATACATCRSHDHTTEQHVPFDAPGREASTECRGYPDENAPCIACGRCEDAHTSGREATPVDAPEQHDE